MPYDSKSWFGYYKDVLKSHLIARVMKEINRDEYTEAMISLHDELFYKLNPYSRFKPFYLSLLAGNILTRRFVGELDSIMSISSIFGFFTIFSKFLDKITYHFFKDMPNLGVKEFLARYFSSDGFNYRSILKSLKYDQYSVTEAHLRHVEEHAHIHHFAMVNFGMIGLHHGVGILGEHASAPYKKAFLLGYLPFHGWYKDYHYYSFLSRFAAVDLPSNLLGFQDYMERVVCLSMGEKPFIGLNYFTTSFRLLDSPTSVQLLEKVSRNFILSRTGTFDLINDVDFPRNQTEVNSLRKSSAVKYVSFLKRPLNQYHSHFFILQDPSPINLFTLYNAFRDYLFWDYVATMDTAFIRIWDPYLKVEDVLNASDSFIDVFDMVPLRLDFDTPLRNVYKTANFARIPFRHLLVTGEGRSLFPYSLDFIEYKLESLDLEKITSCSRRDISIERFLFSELHFSCPEFSIIFYPPIYSRTFSFEFSSPYSVAPLDSLLRAIFPEGASMRPMTTDVLIPHSSFSDGRVNFTGLSPYSTRLHLMIDWNDYEENEKGFIVHLHETPTFPLSIWFSHAYVQEFIRWFNFSRF